METTDTITTEAIRVRVTGKGRDFRNAVKYARQCDGIYDPETKTWEIQPTCSVLQLEAKYGHAPAEWLALYHLTVVEEDA